MLHFVYLFFLILFFLSSCEPFFGYPPSRSKHEEILGVQSIINRIREFNANDIEKNFYIQNIEGHGPLKVILLGERHDNMEGILLNWGFINWLSKKHKVTILQEGLSRKVETQIYTYRPFEIILRLYWREQWLIFRPYNMTKMQKWISEQISIDEIKLIFNNNDFSNLFILRAKYGFWDSRKGLIGDVDYSSVTRRNRSLIKALNHHLSSDEIVIIIAGYLHLPLGEYLSNTIIWPDDFNKDTEEIYDSHYKKMAFLHKSAPNNSYFGSSENIYRALKELNIGFFQAIPKASFVR